MKITTKVKTKWIELYIEEGSTVIQCDIWQNELNEFKEQLENVISDIDYMIEKLNKQPKKD